MVRSIRIDLAVLLSEGLVVFLEQRPPPFHYHHVHAAGPRVSCSRPDFAETGLLVVSSMPTIGMDAALSEGLCCNFGEVCSMT